MIWPVSFWNSISSETVTVLRNLFSYEQCVISLPWKHDYMEIAIQNDNKTPLFLGIPVESIVYVNYSKLVVVKSDPVKYFE